MRSILNFMVHNESLRQRAGLGLKLPVATMYNSASQPSTIYYTHQFLPLTIKDPAYTLTATA